MPAGGYVTFAQTTAMAGVPGFTPDFSYPTGFTMLNDDCAAVDTL